MSNSNKQTIKLSTILKSSAFQDGYIDGAIGLPFDPDAHAGQTYYGFSAPYLYEQGRYFAAHCKAERGHCPHLKYGRTVSRDAVQEYRNAMLSGAV